MNYGKAIKIPCGYDKINDKFIYISEVKSGKSNLVCPVCSGVLVACKGDVRQWYFRHFVENCPCTITSETFLHKWAKNIIKSMKQIKIPKLILKFGEAYNLLIDEQLIKFDNVEVESRQKDIIFDAIGIIKNKKLGIEIVVSNDIDAEKKRKIIEAKIPTIKVYLKNQAKQIFNDLFSQKHYGYAIDVLINSTKYKQWVYHPKLQEYIDDKNFFFNKYFPEYNKK